MKAITPADLTEKPKRVVSGNALTSVKMAFEAGFRACLAGKSIASASYKNPLMTRAWERGWTRAQQLKQKEK